MSFEPRIGTPSLSDHDRLMHALANTHDKTLRSAYSRALKQGKKLVIDKRFIDARRGKAKIIYRFDFRTDDEILSARADLLRSALPYKDMCNASVPPVVIGFGPAGIFASLVLAEYGLRPVVIERGSEMDKRVRDVESFRSGKGDLDPECNVQFGEGGAGTFSDGKLFTGLNSGLKGYIAQVFINHGADPSIIYDSHPHIGTDRLREIIVSIRQRIIALGGQVFFDTRLDAIHTENGKITGIEVCGPDGSRRIECNKVILAIGHSSRDTFRYLHDHGITMESKPFAVGVRIEHKRSDIDIAQYGIDTSLTGDLDAANYKLAVDTVTGRKLYTFCMCPGGEVINASSGKGQAVVNGMSYSGRDLDNSNSALLVPVNREDYGNEVLSGIIYQERLENLAYIAAGSKGKIPVMLYGDLKRSSIIQDGGAVMPSVKPGYTYTDLRGIFDPVIIDTLTDGIEKMGRKIKGFDSNDAVLSAVESRSSSPVRILRDKESRESISLRGLYPAGEGAGYAGGIMSSAIDGINCANSLAKCYII